MIVRNDMGQKQEAGGNYYTRVGALHFDKDGYLADPTNGRVQGFMADQNGDLSSKLTDIQNCYKLSSSSSF